MTDDTRPDPADEGDHPQEPPVSLSELGPTRLDLLCPPDVRQELTARRAEGEALLASTLHWAQATSGALSRYEDGLAGQELTDDLHRALGAAVGVADLFAIADELAEVGEILAGSGR